MFGREPDPHLLPEAAVAHDEAGQEHHLVQVHIARLGTCVSTDTRSRDLDHQTAKLFEAARRAQLQADCRPYVTFGVQCFARAARDEPLAFIGCRPGDPPKGCRDEGFLVEGSDLSAQTVVETANRSPEL